MNVGLFVETAIPRCHKQFLEVKASCSFLARGFGPMKRFWKVVFHGTARQFNSPRPLRTKCSYGSTMIRIGEGRPVFRVCSDDCLHFSATLAIHGPSVHTNTSTGCFLRTVTTLTNLRRWSGCGTCVSRSSIYAHRQSSVCWIPHPMRL